MSLIHSLNIDNLKREFQNIITLNEEIIDKKDVIFEKLAKLKSIYNELIKNNNKKIFLFCLDSFYFQYKLLTIEMENIKNNIILVNNRMYGDYYKLYNIILLQIKEKNIEVPTLYINMKKHPLYKDLEPYHEYSIENIVDVHNDILKVIDGIHKYYLSKESNISSHNDSTKIGNSIINFINTLEYENSILREQIVLYFNYVTFFHNVQLEHLLKLGGRVNAFQKNIDEDIMTTRKQLPINSPNLYKSENFLEEYFVTVDSTKLEKLLNDSDSIVDEAEKLLDGFENIIVENTEDASELIVRDSSGNFVEKIKNEFFLSENNEEK